MSSITTLSIKIDCCFACVIIYCTDMIQEFPQEKPSLLSLLKTAEPDLSQTQLFELYLQINDIIAEENSRQQTSELVDQLFLNIKNVRLFKAILSNFIDKIATKSHNYLDQSVLKFIKEYFNQSFAIKIQHLQINQVIADCLIRSKGNFIEKVIDQCKNSQTIAHNFLFALNEMLLVKIRSDSVANFNLTLTSLFALKVIQYWQSSSIILLQQAFRHILLIDYIQRGQLLLIISQNPMLLNILRLQAEKQANLNGYWFHLVSKLIQLHLEQNNSNLSLTEQLQQKALEIVVSTIQTDKDLSLQIYNINHSILTPSQRMRMIQMVRGYCLFISTYTKKQIKMGSLQQNFIELIEQLISIKDFLSFQYLVVVYAEICQINQSRIQKLPAYMIEKIERNCLPIHKKTNLLVNKQEISQQLVFLQNKMQQLYRYESSLASAEAMQFLLDKILEERGCRPKPRICPCFDSYMHTTIEMQYDQEFNEHDFISVTNLMCREAIRVISMNPDVQPLQKLKSYILENIKWLLNLNQSCLAEYKRCINFKIFDLIVTFPYILNNNEFLQQVIEDLLVNRIPQTFYHISKLIQFYQKSDQQGNSTGLDRIGQKLLAKGSNQVLTLVDKINLWNLVMTLWQNNQEKLIEVLQIYSLHQGHWIAKNYAAKHRKLKLMEPYSQKVAQIQEKWQKNSSFFSEEISVVRRWQIEI